MLLNAQDSPTMKNHLSPDVNSLRLRNARLDIGVHKILIPAVFPTSSVASAVKSLLRVSFFICKMGTLIPVWGVGGTESCVHSICHVAGSC